MNKVLLIDDNSAANDMLSRMVPRFADGPWVLEWADTYATGLKMLLSGRYVVCLLDYRLDDGKDGLQLLREARAAGNTTPTIFLTADTDPTLDEAALQAGAMDFLVKAEFTPRMLARSVRYARKLGDTLEQLRLLATHDALTGLKNRREFERLMAEEWQRCARFQRSFSLVICDIDHFKRINDTYGHAAGDAVLQHVAGLLRGQLRTVDQLARIGGEEFAIIMLETGRDDAVQTIQRLLVLLGESPCTLADHPEPVTVTLSAGLATMPEDADTQQGLFEAADKALYTAKRTGRNRLVTAGGKLAVK
ncbi:putative diguanylate cyclase AdrA [Lacunisphaera limnophila]|uniref:diguanylate cyclase n=1 Tax=Lacunisphaera limnophila TaxID=1838286 RepID=A0A1D8AWH8_9BACT|nr:GGDEF domain-containing response regulator [Lacunisphaera limnophila]AOS45236.1 putative diguanylate cyclase AdrA [Lacunisphaera limnophila]